MSLANKPVLLLADEPTGEVDTSTAQVIMDTLRLLNEQYGLTILLVTHDVRVSGQVDRVVTIRDGRTSSERVRRLREQSIAEEAVVVAEQPEAVAAEPQVDYHEYVVVDYAGRLQLPREYLEAMGISDRAQVDLTDEGIVVRPARGVADASSQAARVSEVAETWGPQQQSKDWRLRVADASRGLRGLLRQKKEQ